jgi:hypothetical protein
MCGVGERRGEDKEREGERIRREKMERVERSGLWISEDPTTQTHDPCDFNFDQLGYCCVRILLCMFLCRVSFQDIAVYVLFAVCPFETLLCMF